MSESKTPTPRTYAVAFEVFTKEYGNIEVVPLEDARTLELELNEAREEIIKLEQSQCSTWFVEKLRSQLTTAQQEIAELKRDKDRLDKAEELKREFKCTSDASDWSLILPFIRPEKPSNLSLREALDSEMKGTKE